MGLTSQTFLIFCIVLALGAPVATIFLWSRLMGPGPVRALQRLMLIGVCQLTAIAVVATVVNNTFYFYSSWADLLGTSPVVASSPNENGKLPPAAAGSANGQLPASAAIESNRIAAARRAQSAGSHGVVLSQTIHGMRTGLSTSALIYLPPQYFQPQYAQTRFPVVLIYPGYPGNPKLYLTLLPVPQIMQAEVSAGRAKPFIAVLVKETVVAPRDTECANVVNGPQVETFLTQEVQAQLSHVLRTRTDRQGWAMMGDSTGGFCAVKMVMQNPMRYGSAVGLSGYYNALLDHTTGSLYGGSARLRNENSPLWRLQHLPAPPVAVLATISAQERTYPQTAAFVRAARAPMEVSSIVAPSGGHNTRNWGAMLPRAVDWLSQQFADAPPSSSPTVGAASQATGAAIRDPAGGGVAGRHPVTGGLRR
jgi:S-formylglutathione hydrolase FrmB